MKISVGIMPIMLLLIRQLNGRLITVNVYLVTLQQHLLLVTLDAMSTVKHVLGQEVASVPLVKMDILYQVHHVFQAILEDPTGSEEKGQVEEALLQMGLHIHAGV